MLIIEPMKTWNKKDAAAQFEEGEAAILLTTTCSSPKPIMVVINMDRALAQLIIPNSSSER